jgi:hypothetical protein
VFGQFSIPLPMIGSIHDLEVNINTNIATATDFASDSYVFQIYRQVNAVNNGTTQPSGVYAPIAGASATATVSQLTPTLGVELMISNLNTGSWSVAAGDRIVMTVSQLITNSAITYNTIGYSASVSYSSP